MPQKRKTTSGRKPSSANHSSKRPSKRGRPPAQKQSQMSFMTFYRHPVGKVLIILLAIFILIGINLLVTLNDFDKFFILTGVQVILAILIGWVIYVIRGRAKDPAKR